MSPSYPVYISQAKKDDWDAIIPFWLQCSIAAHPFIDATHWHESAAILRHSLLPKAVTWLVRDTAKNQIIGFSSVVQQQFLGTFFISSEHHGRGVAQQLMAYTKKSARQLFLEVYQQNLRAIAFYQKEGFHIVNHNKQPTTKLPTWIMLWENASTALNQEIK
jgi:putative acetyltransferase